MNAKDLKLDYFMFYDIKPKPRVGKVVALQGQFDDLPEKARLRRLRLFANPVSKNGEEIHNRHAHLTVYELEVAPWSLDPLREIEAESQFGKHNFDISHEFAMLAPARKYESGLTFPGMLDHYKVYTVEPRKQKPFSLGVEVKLKDQFSAVKARIGNLVAFAVPVDKEHDGKTFQIHNEKAHLMIFACETPNVQRFKRVADQFRRYDIFFGQGLYLGVPCIKHNWRLRLA